MSADYEHAVEGTFTTISDPQVAYQTLASSHLHDAHTLSNGHFAPKVFADVEPTQYLAQKRVWDHGQGACAFYKYSAVEERIIEKALDTTDYAEIRAIADREVAVLSAQGFHLARKVETYCRTDADAFKKVATKGKAVRKYRATMSRALFDSMEELMACPFIGNLNTLEVETIMVREDGSPLYKIVPQRGAYSLKITAQRPTQEATAEVHTYAAGQCRIFLN